jgi:hypothetical protein
VVVKMWFGVGCLAINDGGGWGDRRGEMAEGR